LRARLAAALLCAALAGAAPADAAPPPSEAQKLYERGLQLYSARQYEAAISSFQKAFDLDGRREILFAWAQAERLSGDCPSAVVLYRRFLAMSPGPREVEAAQLNLKRCERALATRPEGEPAPNPVDERAREAEAHAAAAEARAAAEAAARRGPPFYRDRVGGALLGVGAGLLVVGAGVAGASAATESAARSAANYGE
jgi:tetratricopeptide (TPR) repeat protein